MNHLRRLTWATIVLSLTIANQNCGGGFSSTSKLDTSSSSTATPACLSGDTQMGYAQSSALAPQTCGARLTKTCVDGVWDSNVSFAATCTQYCLDPSDGKTPQIAGTSFVSFSAQSATTQAACDATRVTSTCDATTGTYLPAAAAYSSCKVTGQTCAYSTGAGRATPTGNSPGATVTGYASSSATYPNLCGAQVTRTCQATGDWTGSVPLYTSCAQNCVHPDTGLPVPSGTSYGPYYTRSSGTQAECDAARVTSMCQAATGLFAPAPPANRYATCTVINTPPTLNCNLKSDTTAYAMPTLAKPGYLQTYTDPVFGTKITRITGDVGSTISSGGTWGDDVHHQYSKIQAFNADQSLIFIETNRGSNGSPGVFLDGTTYKPVISANCPGNECLWHPTDPTIMVYATSNSVGYWNPRTNARTTIATFSGYSGFTFGHYEGNLSLDGSLVALTGIGPNGKETAFAYDLVKKMKYPDIDFSQWCGTSTSSDGWVSVSPKGTYMVSSCETGAGQIVTTLTGAYVNKLPSEGPSHADMTVDQNGDEVLVGGNRVSGGGGRAIKNRLRDGVITQLSFAGGYTSHASTRDTNLRTWGVSSIFSDSSLYKNEIIMYNLDGTKVYRLAHDQNPFPDYEAETHPTFSPDGLRVIFASAWGGTNSRPVSVYVIDLRTSCTVGN